MLVIVSDLHFSDGTTGGTIGPGAVQLFMDRLFDLTMRASWRANGVYRPVDRLDVLLLGDILDLTRTNHWLQSDVRPWDAAGPGLAQAANEVLDRVLQHNSEAIAAFRSLATQPLMALPPANQAGLPALEMQRHEVEVRLHYMVGDHDWLLHVEGAGFDAMRRKVIQALGLAHPDASPFAHDPLESPEILELQREHRVLARHGDVFDPLHFSDDRGASSLADAIGIELINRFCREVERHYSQDLPQLVKAGMREIDHIRPILMVPVWIDALLERSSAAPAVRRKLKHVWDQLVDEFLQLEIVRNRETASSFDVIDGLESALKFSARSSIDWPKRIQGWLNRIRGIEGESYLPHALGEPDFRNRRARHIVYGHTHIAETSPLEASYADGYVLHQTYFNTGSWRRVYRPALGNPKSYELMPSECLQFNAFFRDDERSGRTFEAWSGMLDASGPERWMHRLDGPEHAAAQSVSTSTVSFGGPHFDVSIAAATSTAKVTR